MRPLVLVVLALVFAGCSGSPQADAPEDAGSPAGGVGSGSGPAGEPGNATADVPRPLRFSGEEAEKTAAFDGSFPIGEGCFPGAPCTAQRLFDLTPIVASEVPVQTSLQLTSDAGPGAFVFVDLRLDQAMVSSYEYNEEATSDLVAVVVLMPGGKVEAAVTMFFPSVLPPAEVKFHLEARTVVRPSAFPTGLPVALELGPGQALRAAGDQLEDFVVIPPGGKATHHLGPFVYNATAAGRHVVVATGQGDVQVFGPVGTALKPLLVEVQEGAPHAITGGQDLTWEFTIEGIPLYVGLFIETADQAQGFAVAPFHGNYEVSMTHNGAEVLAASETGCVASCGFSLLGSGIMDHQVSDYLDEHLGPGAYQVSARFEAANGMQVREMYAYVVP